MSSSRDSSRLQIEWALQASSTPALLQELGFRPDTTGSDSPLTWQATFRGVNLQVLAGPDLFGSTWVITGTCVQARAAMWDERVVLPEEPRGKLALVVLNLWREAFGSSAPPPEALEVGRLYEQYLRDKARLPSGPPTLYLDGDVLRACRKWLAERHGHELSDDSAASTLSLRLSYDGTLLHMVSPTQHFACPASGLWLDDADVVLQALVETPPACLRGAYLPLQRHIDGFTLAWHLLPFAVHPPTTSS